MAVLKNLDDLNAILKAKGVAPVTQTSTFRLTPTEEEVRNFKAHTQDEQPQGPVLSEDQLFIQKAIEEVIQHYKLDQTPGFYGDDERYNALQVRQGVIYQVLNQKQILFEFFKKNCYESRQLERLERFNHYYDLAVKEALQMK